MRCVDKICGLYGEILDKICGSYGEILLAIGYKSFQ